jgi:type I restriction-modification system DNA methylase subunit
MGETAAWRSIMKIAPLSLGILLILPVGFAAGQSQTPPPPPQQDAQSSSTSLAEAAKRAREAKKDEQKPAHVWDNDTVPKVGAQISVVGEAPAGAETDNSAAGAAADNSANGATAKSPSKAGGEDKTALKSQLADAKERLSTLKTDLDLLERTYTLDSQMYYGKPDYSSDKEGAAKLKDEQDQIAAKQQEMDDQQKKIDELEAELAKVAPPTSEENSN